MSINIEQELRSLLTFCGVDPDQNIPGRSIYIQQKITISRILQPCTWTFSHETVSGKVYKVSCAEESEILRYHYSHCPFCGQPIRLQ